MVTNISILVNETAGSFCSDEIKKLKRELQRLMLGPLFAECLVFMNYILYLLLGNGEQVQHVLLYAYWMVSVLILVLMQMKICYDAHEQHIWLHEVCY